MGAARASILGSPLVGGCIPRSGWPARRRQATSSMSRLLPRGYSSSPSFGIAVGVAGLVALGAMAERITRFIEGGDRFVLGQISVAGEGMGMGAGFTAGRAAPPPPRSREIAGVPGVAGVQPQVMLPLKTTTSHFLTLTQELVVGMDVSVPMPNRHYRELPVAGRPLPPGRATAASRCWARTSPPRASSAWAAASRSAGLALTVVGVLDKTLTAPDRFAIVAIEDARDLWLRRDPLLVQVFGAGGLRRGRSELRGGGRLEPGRGSRRGRPPHPGVRGRGQRHDSRRAEPCSSGSRRRSSPRCSSGSAPSGS